MIVSSCEVKHSVGTGGVEYASNEKLLRSLAASGGPTAGHSPHRGGCCDQKTTCCSGGRCTSRSTAACSGPLNASLFLRLSVSVRTTSPLTASQLTASLLTASPLNASPVLKARPFAARAGTSTSICICMMGSLTVDKMTWPTCAAPSTVTEATERLAAQSYMTAPTRDRRSDPLRWSRLAHRPWPLLLMMCTRILRAPTSDRAMLLICVSAATAACGSLHSPDATVATTRHSGNSLRYIPTSGSRSSTDDPAKPRMRTATVEGVRCASLIKERTNVPEPEQPAWKRTSAASAAVSRSPE
mmetsp:Transcript_63400/g.125370  ORF Transcript_63400/g.125370 Transcript_63400/m.125370 type:complete len:300 (+) Transcript_63400:642-1541(+)